MSLIADGSKLTPSVQKEAAKAGDAGAKTIGQKLGGALRTDGLKVFGAVASAAFGLATKGALELENATARYRAETGASADEAARAGKIINKVAGDERMALESVTDIAIRVRRDLGAVGDEADDLTARFARYARVTRQEAGGAVTDFDDILDAWNLTADKSGDIMDRLIASEHKYGGDIGQRQKDLAALAPQLRALNASYEDGIALQNLFAASGLDSSKAMFALNTAVQKVKPGQTIDDLIKQVSSIQDPTERAQKAIEIFGARGGVSLANVLRPGIDSLADFRVSADEAAGAVDKAADVLDTTFSGRIQKFFSQAGAAIRGFGADFGAATTALASVGTLVASVGGGKLLKGLARITLRPIAGLGVRIATFIAGELAGSAAVNAIGNNLATGLERVPGVSRIKGALGKVGSALGSPLGKAIGVATAIAFVVWFADELNKRRQEVADQAKSIGDNVGQQIATGTTEQLTQSRDAIKAGIDRIVADTKRGPIQMATPQQIDALNALVEQYNRVQTELNDRAQIDAGLAAAALRAATPATEAAARDLSEVLPTALEKGQAAVAAAAELWANKSIGEKLVALGHEARLRGAQAALDLASGLRDRRSAVTAAMDQLRTDLKNAMSPKKLAAQDIGLLFGKDLTKGLRSSDPVVKAQAKATRALLEDELIETVKAGGKAGQDILDELNRKMKSKDPAVADQAKRTKSVIDAALKANTAAKTPGDVIGDQLNADLKDKGTTLGRTAYTIGKNIAQNLIAGVKGSGYVAPTSSTGVTGTTYKPPVYHGGTGYVPETQLAMVQRGEIIVPEPTASAIRSGQAVLGGSTGTNGPLVDTLYVDARGATDPAAVGDAVRDAVGDAMANVLRDQSLRGSTGVAA